MPSLLKSLRTKLAWAKWHSLIEKANDGKLPTRERENLARKALAIAEFSAGPDDLRVGRSLVTLIGRMNIRIPEPGVVQEMETLGARALAILEKPHEGNVESAQEHRRDLRKCTEILIDVKVILQKYAEAEALLRRHIAGIEIHATNPRYYFAAHLCGLAEVCEKQHHFEDAGAVLDRFLSYEGKLPIDAGAVASFANLSMKLGRREDAERLYDTAMEMYEAVQYPPTFQTSLNHLFCPVPSKVLTALSEIYAQTNRPEKAILFAERAAEAVTKEAALKKGAANIPPLDLW